MLSNTWNKSVLKLDEKGQSRDKSKNYEIIFCNVWKKQEFAAIRTRCFLAKCN